jgi:hypothetical protein
MRCKRLPYTIKLARRFFPEDELPLVGEVGRGYLSQKAAALT